MLQNVQMNVGILTKDECECTMKKKENEKTRSAFKLGYKMDKVVRWGEGLFLLRYLAVQLVTVLPCLRVQLR